MVRVSPSPLDDTFIQTITGIYLYIRSFILRHKKAKSQQRNSRNLIWKKHFFCNYYYYFFLSFELKTTRISATPLMKLTRALKNKSNVRRCVLL